MKKWKKQKHTGLAIYYTEAGMFLEKIVFSLFWLFLILKNENNIFDTLIKSEDLTLKIDLAYKKSPPLFKSEQQCSMTHTYTNSTKKSPLVAFLITIFYNITKIVQIINFCRSPWHLHFRILLWAYFYPWSHQIFFVVKIMLG